MGNKIQVFGSEYLLKTPISILELKGCPLKIFYNGMRVVRNDKKLGYQKKVTFLKKISQITKYGGTVSCIEVRIKKIVENKVFLKYQDFKKTTEIDKIEYELEKMSSLLKHSNSDIKQEEIVVRKYKKVCIEDESGSCLLTLWNNVDINLGCKYRFISLRINTNSSELHLCTTNRTHIKEIK